ncbi:hypothetical protein PG984_003403 [Apiospora sp. TS-2023a]
MTNAALGAACRRDMALFKCRQMKLETDSHPGSSGESPSSVVSRLSKFYNIIGGRAKPIWR